MSNARKCPYCPASMGPQANSKSIGYVDQGPSGYPRDASVEWTRCPACDGLIAYMKITPRTSSDGALLILVWPRTETRRVPPEVPTEIGDLYRESVSTLEQSNRASAALARTCLQTILRDKGYQKHNLASEIDDVLESKTLPSHIAEDLDAIRQYGNFSAHPIREGVTGAIVTVEDNEAEWCLNIIEDLFDFYYVAPAKSAERRDGLSAKLRAANRRGMKKPPADE